MNYQFLSPLSQKVPQLKEIDKKFYLYNDFEIPKQSLALEYGEFMVNFFNKYPTLNESILGTKACLTGPFTLTFETILKGDLAKQIKPLFFEEPRAVMVDWIVDKYAGMLKRLGTAYNNMGIDIISCDEPILGLLVGKRNLFHTEDFIINTINKAISGIKSLSSIHVCGRISPNLRDLLLKTNVNILDHEFSTNEQNFEIFEKKHFQKADKFLAMGTVESKFVPIPDKKIEDYVENIEFLKKYIKKGIDHYGEENLIIKPDCGFYPLKVFGERDGYEIALRKVKNMVLALKSVK
jgi:methionine synthase II (cobalamin-independent)